MADEKTRPIRKKYSHAIANARQARKRDDAETRQAERITRSDVEQIVKLDAGGFKATKERARLGARNGG